MPKNLPETAKTEWRRVVRELSTLDLLQPVDASVLEAYVRTWHHLQRVEQAIDDLPDIVFETGKAKYPMVRPEFALRKQLSTELRAYMVQLGLSPAARTRLAPAEATDEADPVSDLERRRKNRRRVRRA